MDGAAIDFVRLEEQLNRLLYDPEIRKRRSALPAFVTRKLRERVRMQLKAMGITPAAEAEFYAAQTIDATQIMQILQERQRELGLSGRKFREFRITARGEDRMEALAFLQEVLLTKEQIRFQKEAGIVAKVWLNFLHCRVLPGEATLEKLRCSLTLTPEECAAFDRRIIQSVFTVDEGLRAEVRRLWESTGMTVSQFLVYAWISKDAWEAFYPIQGIGTGQGKRTNQETLLKLVIGCGLEETAAKAFLERAGSLFVVRRDLVVLSGIRCGYCRPMQMQEILEFFARGGQTGSPATKICIAFDRRTFFPAKRWHTHKVYDRLNIETTQMR